MKVIDKLKSMTAIELANFFHYEISDSDCSSCIINNLNKSEEYCNNKKEVCTKRIARYLESEEK